MISAHGSFPICPESPQRRLTVRTVHIPSREAREIHTEHHTSAIGVARRLDVSTDGGIGEGVGGGQGGNVRGTSGIALDNLCVSKLASGTRNDRTIEGWVALNGDRGGGSWRWRILGANEGQTGKRNRQNGGEHVGD